MSSYSRTIAGSATTIFSPATSTVLEARAMERARPGAAARRAARAPERMVSASQPSSGHEATRARAGHRGREELEERDPELLDLRGSELGG